MTTKQETTDEAIRQAWPTIKQLLEGEVLASIRHLKDQPSEAGAVATAAVRLIDSIDSRYGEATPKPPSRRAAALKTM